MQRPPQIGFGIGLVRPDGFEDPFCAPHDKVLYDSLHSLVDVGLTMHQRSHALIRVERW